MDFITNLIGATLCRLRAGARMAFRALSLPIRLYYESPTSRTCGNPRVKSGSSFDGPHQAISEVSEATNGYVGGPTGAVTNFVGHLPNIPQHGPSELLERVLRDTFPVKGMSIGSARLAQLGLDRGQRYWLSDEGEVLCY